MGYIIYVSLSFIYTDVVIPTCNILSLVSCDLAFASTYKVQKATEVKGIQHIGLVREPDNS